jgi:hypothetical protein
MARNRSSRRRRALREAAGAAPQAKRARTTPGGAEAPAADQQRKEWANVPKTNALFERFYQAQPMLDADAWPAFMEALRTPLPTTFRITGTRTYEPARLCVRGLHARADA